MRARADRGQVLPLLVLILVAAVGVALVVGRMGARADDRARAATAADAAALAGAADGRGAAADLAAANGGVLESFEVDGDTVTVVVAVGAMRASASAERTGGIVPAA